MKRLEYCDNKNIIFKQLRAARKQRGLSQADLAARMQTHCINIDQQTISKIEKNARVVTDYELACFCKVLNVDEKFLLKDYYDSEGTP